MTKELRLHNTLTGEIEALAPVRDERAPDLDDEPLCSANAVVHGLRSSSFITA